MPQLHATHVRDAHQIADAHCPIKDREPTGRAFLLCTSLVGMKVECGSHPSAFKSTQAR